jgi:pimeloyl-ACP methyl ester carboxylesterase
MSSAADLRVWSWTEAEGFESRYLSMSDGVRLRIVEAGPITAPRVILLHGAPQMAYEWRLVMRLLKDEYRLIAPDLRGFGSSELSLDGHYPLTRLRQDLHELIVSTGSEPCILVGHDWGGIISWSYAEEHPENLRHLVMPNAPHLGVYAREIVLGRQLPRSLYVLLFQLKFMDKWARPDQKDLLIRALEYSGKGVFNRDEICFYRNAMMRPGRVPAVLGYYRDIIPKNVWSLVEAFKTEPIEIPTTILWGDQDPAFTSAHPFDIAKHIQTVRIVRFRHGTHWLPEQYPQEIARAIRAATRP